jgi:predicted LPLAT superfamily acyltransferase
MHELILFFHKKFYVWKIYLTRKINFRDFKHQKVCWSINASLPEGTWSVYMQVYVYSIRLVYLPTTGNNLLHVFFHLLRSSARLFEQGRKNWMLKLMQRGRRGKLLQRQQHRYLWNQALLKLYSVVCGRVRRSRIGLFSHQRKCSQLR